MSQLYQNTEPPDEIVDQAELQRAAIRLSAERNRAGELVAESLAEFSAGSVEAVPPKEPDKQPELLTTYRVITEVLSRDEAARSRRPNIKNRKCVVCIAGYLPDRVWSTEGNYYTKDIEKAFIYTVGEAINTFGSNDLFELLDEEILNKRPPSRQFDLEQCVDKHTLALIKASPDNPMIRGIILARFGRKPKADVVGYDALRHWVEFNCEKPRNAEAAANSVSTPAQVEAAARPAFSITATRSHMETCRARIKRKIEERSVMHFSQDEIQEIIADSDSFGGMVDSVQNNVEEYACENIVDEDASDQHELVEVIESESEDGHEGWDTHENVAELLRQFIRSHYSASEAEGIINS